MGRTTTPTYRIEFRPEGPMALTNMRWPREAGRPTAENLGKHVRLMLTSFQPGGVNEHVGPVRVTAAWIVHQATGTEVAKWTERNN